jgi:GNAT superfamily N-acetyltransferase
METGYDMQHPVPEIRPIQTTDSVEEITDLLHRAFARLGAMGMNCTAVDQTSEVTAKRLARGECYLAVVGGGIVGTVVLEHPSDRLSASWYRQPFVASAHLLAVAPEWQGKGIGSALMDVAEQWALEHGYAELAVATAEPATHLVKFYAARGHRQIEFAQWEGKSYRSLILSKTLGPRAPDSRSS